LAVLAGLLHKAGKAVCICLSAAMPARALLRASPRRFAFIVFLLFSGLAPTPSIAAGDEEIKIGLRVISGKEQGLKQWQPTADYLNEHIDGYIFKLVPYDKLADLTAAAERGEFSYVITNPASYVEMEVRFGASRMLTLINNRQGNPYTQFGSVIFTRADNGNIRSLHDTRGKTLIAVSETAFGGWRIALKEFLNHGIDPASHLKEIMFADGNQRNVVYAVRDGKADIGVVRTDMLERMAAEGIIKLNDYIAIDQHNIEGFPFMLSSELYPEWPFAQLPGAPNELSQHIVRDLLNLKPDSKPAISGNYYGWSVPLNYQPVHELLRALKVDPYGDYGKLSLKDAIMQYRYWIVSIIIILLNMLVAGYFVITRNMQLARLDAIAKRKEAEEKLILSEKNLSIQINRAPLGVIRWNTDFEVSEWNPAAEEIFGFSREEALGKHACDLILPPDVREAVDKVWVDLINNKGGTYSVNKNNKKDGTIITCEWHNTPLIDDDGAAIGASSFVSDITERIESEDTLKASEQRWQSLSEASFEGVLFHDAGIILDCNERMEIKFGYTHDELVGTHLLNLIAEQSIGLVRERLLMQSNETYEAIALRKDGSKFPIEISSRGITYGGVKQRAVAIRDLSEYKRAENALREEKVRAENALTELAYQKSALDHHSIVSITDPNGIITYVNDKFCENSKFSREELIGQTHVILNSGMHSKLFFEELWETISGGNIWHGEMINQAKDGSFYWLDSTIVPFRDANGNIMQYIAIRTDITAHKVAEQKLLASQALFSKTFSVSSALIAIIEVNTSKIVSVNDAWLRAMEYEDEDQVIGKTIVESGFWANPDDRTEFLEHMNTNGLVRGWEVRARTNKGSERFFMLAVDYVEYDGKRCFLAVSIDIGERKKTENLEMRLGRIVEGSQNEIYVFDDADLKFTQVNKGACENLGYLRGELLGMTPVDIMPNIDGPLFDAIIAPLRNDQSDEISFEAACQRKDGTAYDAAIKINYLPDESPPQFIAFVEDVTNRKLAEEAVRRSQKMDAVGNLTGGIAHDFNNLLGIILGNLDLLEEDLASNPDLAQLVKTAQRAALRGSEMTKRLLAVSRKSTPKTTSTNINEVISNMAPLIGKSLTPEIEIEKSLSNDLWSTPINQGDLEDAILNMSINARKAMPSGGMLIIATENTSISSDKYKFGYRVQPGDYVHLSISDTGIGIPKDIIDKVFDPFFTTGKQGDGTGLGLSMVNGFVERSNGHITVESTEGVGTTFHIYLPRDNSAKKSKTDPVNTSTEGTSKGTETILVVDDERDLVNLAKLMLTKLGYNVLTAGNAHQAMKILDEHKNGEIDLLFSDIVMPGDMNGLELARTALERYPSIRVLMATGHMQKIADADSYSDITANMLNKPYSKDELVRKVRAVLDGGVA